MVADFVKIQLKLACSGCLTYPHPAANCDPRPWARERTPERLRLSGNEPDRGKAAEEAPILNQGAARFGRPKPGSAPGPPRRLFLAERRRAEALWIMNLLLNWQRR